MGRVARSFRLFQQAEAALLSAIEIYNKPDFKYREETFAILSLKAWELLLKAKLLAENGNQERCLHVYESRQTRAGRPSRKKYRRKNRSGNFHTIGMGPALAELHKKGTRIEAPVRSNLEALTEIRDNAVHYINPSTRLAKRVLEIGTASVKNFIELAKRWFNQDLTQYNLYLMPIGFVQAPGSASAMPVGEKRLLDFLSGLVKEAIAGQTGFHVALDVNVSFKRSSPDTVGAVAVARDPNDPDATRVVLTEEDIRQQYPWDYRELTKRLRMRYIDFKENRKFHNVRRPLFGDLRYVRSRFLDPGNPRSQRKDFYNPNKWTNSTSTTLANETEQP